jgi:Flp pilus assembly protein TadB
MMLPSSPAVEVKCRMVKQRNASLHCANGRLYDEQGCRRRRAGGMGSSVEDQTVQTQAGDHELAKTRTMHKLSIAVAIILFLVLVAGFSLKWAAVYQVAAGIGAFLAIEWQRRLDRTIKELSKTESARGAANAV